jgi:hypothetical protein
MEKESIVALELGFLAFNIRRKKLWCLIWKKKAHSMLLSLMLDPKFKNLHLVSSFIGLE